MRVEKMPKVVFFVTCNIHKFAEARRVLAEYKIATAFLKVKTVEIQDNELEIIARARAMDGAKKCKLPIIVEDSGLFIKELNGFPGPYSSYVYSTIGPKGILKLMEKVEVRDAFFSSVVAFCNPNGTPKCFHGKVEGKISREERGGFGFGFDPIFKHVGGSNKTFAEMPVEEKNRDSHRSQALRNLAEWYKLTLNEGFKY